MGKIIFFVPRPQDEDMVKETFDKENDGAWELEVRFTRGMREIAAEDIQADVVVARGVTGRALKRELHDIPVVELPITAYDVLRAVLTCKSEFGNAKIAIVGLESMISNAHVIRAFTGSEIETILFTDETDAERKIRDSGDRGFNVIIGGGTVTAIARRLGLHAVMVYSGEEAICQALRESLQVGRVRRQEQERAEQFRMILEYSLEGIIAVDERGRISLVNEAAAELTGLSLAHLGQAADTIIPQFPLTQVLRSGEAELGIFAKLQGQQAAVNCVPIRIKNKIIGAVATFQPIAVIQELEGKYRTKLSRKGHGAKAKFADISTCSPRMREVINCAREYSQVDSNVLIVGETGVGKEVFAQSIHNDSSRRHRPFVAVNCAALPENLLESELFGYVEGAFTGAAKGGKMGLFEQAHRGTIFLDEIAEISPKIQARLLRVLQEREIMRIGDDRVVPIDVRIIAATNRDLNKAMLEGDFRPDLYYRLNVLKLEIPPLRERREDILGLLKQFLDNYVLRFQRAPKKLTEGACQALAAYRWPGNVRELRNIAERLAVLRADNLGKIDEVSIAGLLAPQEATDVKSMQLHLGSEGGTFSQRKKAAQLEQIERALQATNFNYDQVAQQLGISRTTLWRRLKEMQGSG